MTGGKKETSTNCHYDNNENRKNDHVQTNLEHSVMFTLTELVNVVRTIHAFCYCTQNETASENKSQSQCQLLRLERMQSLDQTLLHIKIYINPDKLRGSAAIGAWCNCHLYSADYVIKRIDFVLLLAEMI